ncbi:hypothetical protein [Nostoc sp.]|uniref:hypothetical protein n=1 Tax=Nostoc sp. TaxID=1180 RepID=UPI002FFBB37D
MTHTTINAHSIIKQFHEFMKPDSKYRVLRLIGDANMGKSHLLTKVFPELCQHHQACCAVIDLRNKNQTIMDFLDLARSRLTTAYGVDFPNYSTAYKELIYKPIVKVEGVKAFFSEIKIDAKAAPAQDNWHMVQLLTNEFVTDLYQIASRKCLFLFDSVNDADSNTQTWLMDNLLNKLAPLKHVRVIVAGRSFPEAYGSYAVNCYSYELKAVQDVQEYVKYCQQINADLVEQSIKDFASAFDYNPGMFAGYARKFVPQGVLNG